MISAPVEDPENATLNDDPVSVRFVVVVKVHCAVPEVSEYVAVPSFKVRAPVPVPLNPVADESVILLLLTLLSNVPVNVPQVND